MNFVSWEHCYCGENCMSNCVGMPTYQGIIALVIVFAIILGFVIFIHNLFERFKFKKINELKEMK